MAAISRQRWKYKQGSDEKISQKNDLAKTLEELRITFPCKILKGEAPVESFQE